MICQVCGANAEEVRPGHYRCNYCTNEFDDESAGASAIPNDGSNRTYAGQYMRRNGESISFEESADRIKAPNGGKLFAEEEFRGSHNDGERKLLSGEEIYERAIDGIVEVYAANKGESGVACASGFVVSERGFVLTNAHAVLDSYGQIYKIIQVKTRTKVYQAMVVAIGKPADGKNDSIDLCLLYVDGLHVQPNVIGDVSKLRNGQKVYLIGNSLGSGICITSGIVSDKKREMPGLSYPYIMTDAAANHGNSGGPLYNEYGEVIGVLVAGIDGAKGMNYAIPANVVDSFMAYVINGSKIKKANLGELNRYTNPTSTYTMTLSMAFTGIKLVLDVIEFIVGLFKK